MQDSLQFCFMDEVVLRFPNTISLSEFLLKFRVPGLEVSSRDLSIKGNLTDDQVIAAYAEYNAQVITPTPSVDL